MINKRPLYHKEKIIGYCIYDTEKNTITDVITDEDFIKDYNKEQKEFSSISIGFREDKE